MSTPRSLLQQITARIQAATVSGTPLRIRGGGSKDFYGQALDGELLDVSELRGIISYEPSELVVTAYAGTPLAELEAVLAEKGQYLAFEPPHFRSPPHTAVASQSRIASAATVGGMVACGLSGPARASVGAVRDFVLGVKFINGRGELLTFGGQVIKNVAGYDVSRLMAGAMGTLGLLTEISLKVLPVPRARATLVFELDQANALAHLHRWGAAPLPLNASCWLQDNTAVGRPELLFVRLCGALAAVKSASVQMLQDCPGNRIDNTRAAADWQACRDQTLPFFEPSAPEQGLWRLSVPQTAPLLALPFAHLIEWHGGLHWLWAPLSARQQVCQAAADVFGTATLFRAPNTDVTYATDRFTRLESTLAGIHQRLKAEFDPAAIFNRGRMYSEL